MNGSEMKIYFDVAIFNEKLSENQFFLLIVWILNHEIFGHKLLREIIYNNYFMGTPIRENKKAKG